MCIRDSFYAEDRSEQVATFLAMLELIKSKRLRISDDTRYVYFSADVSERPDVTEKDVEEWK